LKTRPGLPVATENAQIEITRAAVRHFALSADVPAFDTTTLNHTQIEP